MIHLLPAFAIVASQPGLIEIESRSYVINSDLPAEEFEQVAKHLDLVHAEFTKRFRGFGNPVNTKLPVWVFQEQDDYLSHLATMGINARGTGGVFFYRPETGHGLAAWKGDGSLDALLGVLRHEGFHQFAAQRFEADLPNWVNEGLAEFFQHSLFTERRASLGLVDPVSLSLLRRFQREGTLLSLEELLAISAREWNEKVNSLDPQARIIYPQAWSVVHFLIRADNGRYERVILSYLKELSRGQKPDRARLNAFGPDLESMQHAWEEHLEQMEPDPVLLARERLSAAGHLIAIAHSKNQPIRSAADLATLAELPESVLAHPALREFFGPNRDWWLNGPAAHEPFRIRPNREGPPIVELRVGRHQLTLEWVSRGDQLVPNVVIR